MKQQMTYLLIFETIVLQICEQTERFVNSAKTWWSLIFLESLSVHPMETMQPVQISTV